MPLSKKRNRERMRIARATYMQPNLVQPTRLIMDKNRILGVQPKRVAQVVEEEAVQPNYVVIGGVRYRKP